MLNDDDAFLNSPFHVIIQGPTGSGKTVVGNAAATGTKRLVVVLNTQAKGYIRGQAIRYRGSQDNSRLQKAVQGGASILNIKPVSEDGTRELQALKEWMWPLAEGDVRFSLFVDEAQDIDEDLLVSLAKRGRDPGSGAGGIKLHSISQRFTSIPKPARTEAEYVIQVGIPDPGDETMLEKQKRFPFDRVRELHSQPKWMHEVEGGETVSHAFSVVKDGEIVFGPTMAAPKFAD